MTEKKCQNCGDIIEVLSKLIQENPNDYDLGGKIRQMCLNGDNGEIKSKFEHQKQN